MKFSIHDTIVCVVLPGVLCGLLLVPVTAENGTISISYRGSGAGYVGDTFIIDGLDTIGNTTILSVTGTGLPREGVPANNLNGVPGAGVPVAVGGDGRWQFSWYTATVPGAEKLVSGRYTFTARDGQDPSRTSVVVLQLRKPEYTVSVSPNPSRYGDYIQITGMAETGISSAKIEIRDSSGNVVHTFTSPVSSSGYLSYSFHSDLQPGKYTVMVSNPVLNVPFGTTLTVLEESPPAASATLVTPGIAPVTTSVNVTTTSAVTPIQTAGHPPLPLGLPTVLAGIGIACAVRLSMWRR